MSEALSAAISASLSAWLHRAGMDMPSAQPAPQGRGKGDSARPAISTSTYSMPSTPHSVLTMASRMMNSSRNVSVLRASMDRFTTAVPPDWRTLSTLVPSGATRRASGDAGASSSVSTRHSGSVRPGSTVSQVCCGISSIMSSEGKYSAAETMRGATASPNAGSTVSWGVGISYWVSMGCSSEVSGTQPVSSRQRISAMAAARFMVIASSNQFQ